MATLKKDGTVVNKGKVVGTWGHVQVMNVGNVFGNYAAKFNLLGKEVVRSAVSQNQLREIITWLLSDEYAETLK